MITVGRLLDLDVGVWLIAGPLALITAILVPLARAQARWQAEEDAADPPGFTSDIGD